MDITLAAWACFPNAIWGQFTLIPSNGCVLHSGHHKILCPWATRGRYQWWRPEGYLSQVHTQFAAIPYADLSTVDKRISDLVSKAFQKLRKNDVRADLSSRVFTKLDDVLARLP